MAYSLQYNIYVASKRGLGEFPEIQDGGLNDGCRWIFFFFFLKKSFASPLFIFFFLHCYFTVEAAFLIKLKLIVFLFSF